LQSITGRQGVANTAGLISEVSKEVTIWGPRQE